MLDKSAISQMVSEFAAAVRPAIQAEIAQAKAQLVAEVTEALGILSLKLPEMMTIDQISKLLGVSRQTLRTWGYEGKFPRPLELDGTVGPKRYARADIVQWLETKRHPIDLQAIQPTAS